MDSGPAALHRLPETVAHVAEALWMQALDEGRRRAQLELHATTRVADEQKQTLEVRSHVLTLREGELDSRLRDRDRTVTELQQQLRELTLMLRREQATRDAQTQRISTLENQLLARPQSPKKPRKIRATPTQRKKRATRRTGQLRRPTTTKGKGKRPKKRPPIERQPPMNRLSRGTLGQIAGNLRHV